MMLLVGFNALLFGAIWICLARGGKPRLRLAAFPLPLPSWDRPGPTLRDETAAGARHVSHGPHPELGPARRPTLRDETWANARPPFHGPHPELVEGRVWDPAPVLGIGRGCQSTSFDKLRMRVVDGGTEFFTLNALANCFFLADSPRRPTSETPGPSHDIVRGHPASSRAP